MDSGRVVDQRDMHGLVTEWRMHEGIINKIPCRSGINGGDLFSSVYLMVIHLARACLVPLFLETFCSIRFYPMHLWLTTFKLRVPNSIDRFGSSR